MGIDTVVYSIVNDSSYSFKNGTLNASTGYDDAWNSTLDVPETIDYMLINFTVTANDTRTGGTIISWSAPAVLMETQLA